MSLDEISKKSNKFSKKKRGSSKKKGGRGRGRGKGRRGGRGGRKTSSKKKNGYSPKRKSRTQNRNNKPYQSNAKRSTGAIAINNLDFEVTEADVKEIFQKIGKVKKAIVHYNAQGRSRGTAMVYFANAAHAIKAVNEYHQAEVDGRPMYVKAVATVSASPKKKVSQKKTRGRRASTPKKKQRSRSQSKGRRGRGGKRRGGKKGGRGGKRKKAPSKTAEQLDKEMEEYHNQGGGSSAVDQISAGQPDTVKLFSGDAEGEN